MPIAISRPTPNSVALLAPAHPQVYPHIERHAQALRAESPSVIVLSIHPSTYEPIAPHGISYSPVQAHMPTGMLGFLGLMASSFFALWKHRPALVEAIDPPCLIPAALYCKLTGASLLYFSMELYAALPSLRNKPLRRNLWLWLERAALAFCPRSKALTVCKSVADKLSVQWNGKPVGVVRNLPAARPLLTTAERSKLREVLRSRLGLGPTDLLLAYQGKIEEGRGLPLLLEWLRGQEHIHLVIWGYGPMDSWLREASRSMPNIHFEGAVPFAELMELGAGVDAGVVYIEPISESYRLSLPGKLFEYIQNQIPVIASPLPEIRAVVEHYRVGEVCATLNSQGLNDALMRLQCGIKEYHYSQGLSIAAQELHWERESNILRHAVRELIQSNKTFAL